MKILGSTANELRLGSQPQSTGNDVYQRRVVHARLYKGAFARRPLSLRSALSLRTSGSCVLGPNSLKLPPEGSFWPVLG